MDAFRQLRRKFAATGNTGNSKSPPVKEPAPKCKPVTEQGLKPATNVSHVTKYNDKTIDNSAKNASSPKPPPNEKKKFHETVEKGAPQSGDRKWSIPDEKVYELQEAFVLFDKNQDGMITKEELGAVLRALGQRPTMSEVQALIHSVDLDQSGTIDFEEFVKIFSAKLSIDPEKELHEVFCIFDENGDGFISSDELYSILQKLGEHITKTEAQKMISEADLNKDGKVDYREFKAILNAR